MDWHFRGISDYYVGNLYLSKQKVSWKERKVEKKRVNKQEVIQTREKTQIQRERERERVRERERERERD